MEVPVEKLPVTFPCRISTWPWPSCWSLQCSEELSGIQHDVTYDHCPKLILLKLLSLTKCSFWTLPFWTFWDFWWDCRVLIKSPFCTCLYCSQLLSAVLLLLRLWDSGTREMDNERSTQGTSAPLLPLLQRFQNIHTSKEEPVPEEEIEVKLNPWIIFIIALFFQVLYLATYALRSFLPLWAQMRVFCATLHCLKIMTWPLICGRQL